jgi:hypothetical protein
MRHDNYPDNIRNFDHDPRSPFYDDGDEEMTLSEREALEEDRAERASEARAEWKAQQNGY